VAANLNAPVILVVSGRNRTPEEIRSAAEGGLAEFRARHAKVIAVIANRVSSLDRASSDEVDPAELEATEAGTVVLEEIADLPAAVQSGLAVWLGVRDSARPRLLATTVADPLAAVRE